MLSLDLIERSLEPTAASLDFDYALLDSTPPHAYTSILQKHDQWLTPGHVC
ncbi:hypothetical protein GCM10027286_22960 [Virgibacillus ainsalahensis]